MFFRAEGLASRIGATGRFLLSLAGIVAGLLFIGLLWAWLSPRAKDRWPAGPFDSIQVSEDGSTVAAFNISQVELWDVVSGQRRFRDEHRAAGDSPLARLRCWLSPDIRTIAFDLGAWEPQSFHRRVRWWNTASSERPIVLHDEGGIHGLAADGRILITRDATGFSLWNMATGKERARPDDMGPIVGRPQGGANGRLFAIDRMPGSPSGLRIWDLTKGKLLHTIAEARPPAAISPDGSMLAGQSGGHGVLWNLNNNREVAVLHREHLVRTVSEYEYSPDGQRLLIHLAVDAKDPRPDEATETSSIQLWDVASSSPSCLKEFDLARLTFGGKGKWLLVDKTGGLGPAIWDMRTCEEVCQLPFFDDHFWPQLMFSPDGKTVAFSSVQVEVRHGLLESLLTWFRKPEQSRRSCRVWDIERREEIACFWDVDAFSYFPDGKCIAISKRIGTLEIWDLPPRRYFLIEYGLPVLFGMLLLAGIWHIRQFRKRSPTVPAVADRCDAPSDAAVRQRP